MERSKFEQYSTRVAFNVQLSRTQIHVMFMALYNRGHNHRIPQFIPAIKACIARGLIVHNNIHHHYQSTGLFSGASPSYSLTKAGYHTARLLEIAFPEEKARELVNRV